MRRMLYALAEQAAPSLAHFVLGIAAARALTQDGFGRFGYGFALMMLVVAIHQSLIVEPMLVLGRRRYSANRAAYLGALLGVHLLLGSVALTVAVILGVVDFHAERQVAVVCFGLLAGIAYSVIVFCRRAFYLVGSLGTAAFISGSYALLVALGAVFLSTMRGAPAHGAVPLGLLIVSALVAGASGTAVLLRTLAGRLRGIDGADLVTSHFEFGRWVVGQTIARWLAPNLLFITLPVLSGFETVGELRGALLLVMPASLFLSALSPLLLSTGATGRVGDMPAHSVPRSDFTFASLGAAVSVGGLCFGALVAIFGGQLAAMLLGPAYALHVGSLALLAFLPPIEAVAMMLSSWFKTQERPEVPALAALVPAAIAIAASFAMLSVQHTSAQALAWVVGANAAYVAVLALALVRLSGSRSWSDRCPWRCRDNSRGRD